LFRRGAAAAAAAAAAWGNWSAPPLENVLVRSKTYLQDRKKQPAGEVMFPLHHVDVIKIDASSSSDSPLLEHVASIKGEWLQKHREEITTTAASLGRRRRKRPEEEEEEEEEEGGGGLVGKDDNIIAAAAATTSSNISKSGTSSDEERGGGGGGYTVIINLQVRSLGVSVVSYHHRPEGLLLQHNHHSRGGEMSDNYRKLLIGLRNHTKEQLDRRFKLITHLEQGPFLMRGALKAAVGANVPVVMGKAVSQRYFFGKDYMEVDVEVDTSIIAKGILKIASMFISSVVVDMVWVLEGKNVQELPEKAMCAVRLGNMDLSKAREIRLEDDDSNAAIPSPMSSSPPSSSSSSSIAERAEDASAKATLAAAAAKSAAERAKMEAAIEGIKYASIDDNDEVDDGVDDGC